MSSQDTHDVVSVATAPNPMQAHIWRQILENEGIKCQVVGDYLDSGLGDVSGMRAEIWVQRGDRERAAALLKKIEEEGARESAEQEAGSS